MIGQKKSIEDFTLSSLSLSELNRVLIRIGDLLSQAHGIGQAHDMHGGRIVNVGSPTQTKDAINKDALDDGLEPKTDGPDSSTDNAVVRWDGDDGRKLQNSLATVDDAGSVNIPTGQTYKIGGNPHTHAFDDLSDVDFTGEAWGDVVYRGEDAWNNLAAGTSGQVLKTAGADADPEWGALAMADLSDLEITDVEQGDMLQRGASAWVNTHHGDAGQIWTCGGDGADNSWEDNVQPSDSVESETSWGISAAAGSSVDYSRADHTHGTPAEPSVSVEDAWPIGSVFLAVVATDPATLLGFGTWARIAEGQLLAGYKSGDADFGTVEGTGGTKTHTLTSDEMPSHTHVQDSHKHDISQHIRTSETGSYTTYILKQEDISSAHQTAGTTETTSVTATNQTTGGGGAHNNLPPYVVVYCWKRTA